MLDYPRRPEGSYDARINELFDLIWKLIEEVNRLQEGGTK